MSHETTSQKDNLMVLYKGGRLPSWYQLPPDKRQAFEQAHVDLMLSVAQEQRLKRLEGFRLVTPQHHFERFWLIEFETLANAEAWITAEMAPPYGHYGYYVYDLARAWQTEQLAEWVTHPSEPVVPLADDPHQIPKLSADQGSIVVLQFERWLLASALRSPEARGDEAQQVQLRDVAQNHNLMRLEAFSLIGIKDKWHRVWLVEFPTLAGAEAWIDASVYPPYTSYKGQMFQLARKWTPAYFASWIPT